MLAPTHSIAVVAALAVASFLIPEAKAQQYTYSPQNYTPVTTTASYHTCGGIPLKRNQWSPWEFVAQQCGVELQVRYMMKNKLAKRVQSTAQFRYVNTRGRDFKSTLYNVHFRLNGGDDIPWGGETVYLGPHSTLEGVRFHMVGDTQLCTFRKCWKVR